MSSLHPMSDAPTDARTVLRSAMSLTGLRLAPGHGVPDQRHLGLLAETEMSDPPRFWTDESAHALAALFAARARRDNLRGGSALVSRYFDDTRLTRPSALSMGARALLLASVGEYYGMVGRPQLAARFGHEAQVFADTDALRYYALAVSTFGFAVNGEYDSAIATMTEANEILGRNGWPVEESSHLVALADALVSAARLDDRRLASVSARLWELSPDDPYVEYSARTVDVSRQLFLGDYTAGLASSWQLLHGSQRRTSQRIVRGFVQCFRSELLVAQGNHAEGLASLNGGVNVEGHDICFSKQRAACLLSLGREQELLVETEPCVAADTDHCLRTLTPLLVQRAIAFRRVGSERRALESMESALLLISRTGSSMAPFIMLPRQECAELIDAAAADRPELADIAATVRAALLRLTVAIEGERSTTPITAFTPTELALARILLTPMNLSDIARQRNVSLNTIKSQVRSIYVKLGVRGRKDAEEALRRVLG